MVILAAALAMASTLSCSRTHEIVRYDTPPRCRPRKTICSLSGRQRFLGYSCMWSRTPSGCPCGVIRPASGQCPLGLADNGPAATVANRQRPGKHATFLHPNGATIRLHRSTGSPPAAHYSPMHPTASRCIPLQPAAVHCSRQKSEADPWGEDRTGTDGGGSAPRPERAILFPPLPARVSGSGLTERERELAGGGGRTLGDFLQNFAARACRRGQWQHGDAPSALAHHCAPAAEESGEMLRPES